jgi:hypothetical protein
MMESLTKELADSTLNIMEEVEEMGGVSNMIKNGMITVRVEENKTKQEQVIIDIFLHFLFDVCFACFAKSQFSFCFRSTTPQWTPH